MRIRKAKRPSLCLQRRAITNQQSLWFGPEIVESLEPTQAGGLRITGPRELAVLLGLIEIARLLPTGLGEYVEYATYFVSTTITSKCEYDNERPDGGMVGTAGTTWTRPAVFDAFHMVERCDVSYPVPCIVYSLCGWQCIALY